MPLLHEAYIYFPITSKAVRTNKLDRFKMYNYFCHNLNITKNASLEQIVANQLCLFKTCCDKPFKTRFAHYTTTYDMIHDVFLAGPAQWLQSFPAQG